MHFQQIMTQYQHEKTCRQDVANHQNKRPI